MEKYNGLEIAVIGLSGRFPKADNITEFWHNLKTGRDCISDFTEQELLEAGIPEDLVRDPLYVRSNAFAERKQYFDSAFFNYRPGEAELMDPQMRVFHECCWEALDDSGYSNATGAEKIGLFATGTPGLNWLLYSNYINRNGLVDAFTAGNLQEISFLCTRISYKLNLNGPSVFSQTACSSSLVAIHQACNSLLLGECNIALAGGVTINNFSRKGYLYKEGMIYSRDGRCHAFDSNAGGTVQGEGAGVVVLKRLGEAIRDRDNICAIIKGSAVNNDGNEKIGYTAPSVKGQAEVIRRALKMAGVNTKSISYVEAHGTGTELGDPVEIEALNSVFGTGNYERNTCAIGSLKSNIGHLDSAAGVAGFIKVVLSLKHRHIPASLHFTAPNPKIDFAGGPFYVNTKLKEWTGSQEQPLRAGVSSFGIGGTNAHAILEEAPPVHSSDNSREYQLLLLSAKTNESLERMQQDLLHYLKENSQEKLSDLSYTLQTGRVRFNHRMMVACNSHEGAIKALDSCIVHTHTNTGNQESLQHIIFMFSGQGSQYVNMCVGLYKTERLFREKVDECLEIARQYAGVDYRSVLFPGGDASHAGTLLLNTAYTQPVLFIIEYSLAWLIISWGIRPHYMIGHSIGEYTAACISGVFSLRDALRLVIKRGRLMSSASAGSMLSISISKEELQPLLEGFNDIDLAVVNSPHSLVVAGKSESIALFEKKVTGLGFPARPVHTSHAFHSWMMDAVLEQFEQEVAAVHLSAPSIPYISNVTGAIADYETIRQPSYWSNHLRSCVEFSRGIDCLLDKGKAVLIEIGPGKTLCNYVAESSSMTDHHFTINTVRQAKQNNNDARYLVEKLGHLWLHGINIDWDSYYSDEERKRVSLPAYSFDKIFYRTDVDAVKLISSEMANQSKTYTYKTEDSIHSREWQHSPLPGAMEALTDDVNDFLIFGDPSGFSRLLADELHRRGQRVITICTGEHIQDRETYNFSVNLSAASEMEQLLQELKNKGIKTNYIIYASALTTSVVPPGSDIRGLALEAGYLGLSYLCKAIARKNETGKTNILVVNNYLADVMQEDEMDPLKSTILGPARLIGIENENIQCKTVDIPFPFSDRSEKEEYVQKVLDELLYDFEENFIAYRYQQRWIPAYSRLRHHPGLQSGVNIKKGKTYIVAGGMGGMGLTITGDLVQNYGAEVIVVHRSPFPGRSEWAEWISEKGEKDETSRRILKLQELEREGGKILLYRVNVAVEEEVQRFMETLRANDKPIAGLIWAAGEVDYGGIILKRSGADFVSYLSSKVHGLLFFEKYLDFRKLEFLALFSSMGNVFYQVKFGQVAYNAANEFLTNYAVYARKNLHIHAFSINWCDWMDVGMTVRTLMQQKNTADIRQINREINLGLTPAEGIAVFHTCLGTRLPACYIYKGNIAEQIRQYQSNLEKIKESFDSGKATGEKSSESPNKQSALIQLYADFFGKTSITLQDDFFELGGDSLKAMTLVTRINQQMGSRLTIADMYKYTTVADMANALALSEEPATISPGNLPATQLLLDGNVYYELGDSQRYWIDDEMEKEFKNHEKRHGLLVINYKINGAINLAHLEQAIEFILQRHECLHSTFHWINGKAMLRVEKEYHLSDIFSYRDASSDKDPFPSEEAFEKYLYFLDDVMDLGKTLPLRIRLAKLDNREYVLSVKIHHITSDAWSNNILFRDLLVAYRAFSKGQHPQLPELKWQYKDIMGLEIEYAKEHREADRNYWAGRFPKAYEPVWLPLPKKKTRAGTFKVKKYETFGIPSAIAAALKSISNKQGTSFFVTLQASFKYYLFYKTLQADQGVGTYIFGRSLEADNLLGNYARLAFVRTVLGNNDSFLEALEKVNKSNEEMREHRAYPLHLYMIEKNPVGKSIFDDFLRCAVQFGSDTNFYMDNSIFESEWQISMMQSYDEKNMLLDMELTFYDQSSENKLLLQVAYNSSNYYLKDIKEFIAGYISFLDKIIAAPRTGIHNLQLPDALPLNVTTT